MVLMSMVIINLGKRDKVTGKCVLSGEEGGQSKGIIRLINGVITAGKLCHSDQL
jgi:hypothetical protein